MSFFDNVMPLREEDKIKSDTESFDLISGYMSDHVDLVDFRNHRQVLLGERQMYRFTLKLLSINMLNKLSKDRRVKNVFYAPSAAPPGGAVDGISSRYKVYVEYN